jgi:hypothetical protein
MKQTLPLVLAAFFLVLSACSTAHRSSPVSPPALVYVPPSAKVIQRRADDLQHQGYSKEEARQKANREADSTAWQEDPAQAAAYYAAQRAAREEQDKLNADLHKLAFEPSPQP